MTGKEARKALVEEGVAEVRKDLRRMHEFKKDRYMLDPDSEVLNEEELDK